MAPPTVPALSNFGPTNRIVQRPDVAALHVGLLCSGNEAEPTDFENLQECHQEILSLEDGLIDLWNKTFDRKSHLFKPVLRSEKGKTVHEVNEI